MDVFQEDPHPLLDSDQYWGLTNEEFKLKFCSEYKKKRKRKVLLNLIIQELRGENEMG